MGVHNVGVGATTAAGEPAAHARPARLLSRLFRAATTSVLATALSQAALIGLLWWGATPALASAVAFTCGAVPNFFISRRWAWGRKGKPTVKSELLPYLVIIGLAGFASVGLTTLAGLVTDSLGLHGLVRIVVLDAVFLGGYAIVFLMKFALLDRLVFRPGRRIRVAKSPS